MVSNSQFGFDLSLTGCTPYGWSSKFVVSSAIKSLAGKASGKWCTAGNLLAYDSSGHYIECSLTYFSSGGAQSQGWYFWYGYNGGAGTYKSLGTYDATGDTVTLYLQKASNGNWDASFYDGSYNTSKQTYCTGVTNFAIAKPSCWFENGGDTTCSDYSSLGTIQFGFLTFYDASNNILSTCSWTASAHRQNNPATCSDGNPCIGLDTSTLKAYYLC
jgi:hypothetical protein